MASWINYASRLSAMNFPWHTFRATSSIEKLCLLFCSSFSFVSRKFSSNHSESISCQVSRARAKGNRGTFVCCQLVASRGERQVLSLRNRCDSFWGSATENKHQSLQNLFSVNSRRRVTWKKFSVCGLIPHTKVLQSRSRESLKSRLAHENFYFTWFYVDFTSSQHDSKSPSVALKSTARYKNVKQSEKNWQETPRKGKQ